MDQNIVCYKCNNIGHKARGCKSDVSIIRKEKRTIIWEADTIWENKRNLSKKYCRLALIAQNKKDECYIDNGCSTHMIGVRNKFINLKQGKSGSVAFGNDSSINTLGKGLVNIGSEKVKETNVLLVEDRKHNLLQQNVWLRIQSHI